MQFSIWLAWFRPNLKRKVWIFAWYTSTYKVNLAHSFTTEWGSSSWCWVKLGLVMTTQKEKPGSCWPCPADSKKSEKNSIYTSTFLQPLSVYRHKKCKLCQFHYHFFFFFFLAKWVSQMLEITTLRNRSSAQDAMCLWHFLFLCTFTTSDNLLTTSEYMKASGKMLNQLRNGISQDLCVLVP